jgi:hypothetical protein
MLDLVLHKSIPRYSRSGDAHATGYCYAENDQDTQQLLLDGHLWPGIRMSLFDSPSNALTQEVSLLGHLDSFVKRQWKPIVSPISVNH